MSEQSNVEVDEKGCPQSRELQVGDYLRVVNWKQLVDGFDFDQKFVVDEEIRAKTHFKL